MTCNKLKELPLTKSNLIP